MVWEFQAPTIVMLTRCVEDGKVCLLASPCDCPVWGIFYSYPSYEGRFTPLVNSPTHIQTRKPGIFNYIEPCNYSAIQLLSTHLSVKPKFFGLLVNFCIFYINMVLLRRRNVSSIGQIRPTPPQHEDILKSP